MGANFLNKVMGRLGFNDEYDDDTVDEMEELETEEIEEKPLRAGYFGRRSSREEEPKFQRATKVLPMTNGSYSSRMVITQPLCYDDVEEVGEYLKQKKSVIINLEAVSKEDHRRIVDFISGATFVTEGSIQKISSLIYLVTPKTVEIQNDIEKSEYRNKLSFSWMK